MEKLRLSEVDNILNSFKQTKMAEGKEFINTITNLVNTFQITYSEHYVSIKNVINTLITEFINTKMMYLNGQRTVAARLNVLDVLGFTYDEIKHSKFLAWLFNSWETHAQGNLFFKLFLEEIQLPLKYSESPYDVKPEVTRDESRIDIEISSVSRGSNAFVIHIENKVGAALTDEQLSREYADLQRAGLEKETTANNVHGFVLSIDEPDISLSKYNFRWISWKTMGYMINGYIKKAEAQKTRWVAQQYLECIEQNIIKEHITEKIIEELSNDQKEENK